MSERDINALVAKALGDESFENKLLNSQTRSEAIQEFQRAYPGSLSDDYELYTLAGIRANNMRDFCEECIEMGITSSSEDIDRRLKGIDD